MSSAARVAPDEPSQDRVAPDEPGQDPHALGSPRTSALSPSDPSDAHASRPPADRGRGHAVPGERRPSSEQIIPAPVARQRPEDPERHERVRRAALAAVDRDPRAEALKDSYCLNQLAAEQTARTSSAARRVLEQ